MLEAPGQSDKVLVADLNIFRFAAPALFGAAL